MKNNILKIALLSDLHIECAAYSEELPNADFLVLAGDICNARKGNDKNYLSFKKRVYEKFGNNVIEISGNHEGYGGTIYDIDSHRGIKIVDNICFIYATLWSGEDSAYAYSIISDLKCIGGFTFNWMLDQHNKDLSHIEYYLNKYNHMTTVVVTHHAPHIDCINKKYKTNSNSLLDLNLAFYTDLDWLIKKYSPDYWFCGHTHDSLNTKIRNTKVFINPRGYNKENINNFDPKFVVHVENKK